MKLIRKNDKEGFTLVELIVVIAILAILALILIPAITGYIAKADKSAVEASARSLYSEAVLKANETGYEMSNLQNHLQNTAGGDSSKYLVEVKAAPTPTSYEVTLYFKDKEGNKDVNKPTAKFNENGIVD